MEHLLYGNNCVMHLRILYQFILTITPRGKNHYLNELEGSKDFP